MRFEILAESNRIGGHTRGSGKSRKTHNVSYITRLTILTMNAGDNVGLLKNLCMKGTIKFDKISEETSHCAYVREDHRVYTKGARRVFKCRSSLIHIDVSRKLWKLAKKANLR